MDKRILPGLVDLQVNGFAGIDFNRPELRTEDVETLCRRLPDEKVVAFLPTLITNDPVVVERLAKTIFRAENSTGAKILGLHLEGPFISPKPGVRGAHPEEWVRPPDFDWIRRMHDVSQGRIELLTLSPEWDGSAALIESVCELGIRVAIGHTSASPEQIADAVRAGATLSTHLGNGISADLPRHPNPIWSQLAEDRLWVSLIGDGFHLSREFFKTVLKVKGRKAFLVSDGTEFTGMEPGRYESPIGGQVVLTPEGKLHLADDERLMAGSAMSLRRMIGTIYRNGWLSFDEAWQLGSVRPWNYLGRAGSPETVEISGDDSEFSSFQ